MSPRPRVGQAYGRSLRAPSTILPSALTRPLMSTMTTMGARAPPASATAPRHCRVPSSGTRLLLRLPRALGLRRGVAVPFLHSLPLRRLPLPPSMMIHPLRHPTRFRRTGGRLSLHGSSGQKLRHHLCREMPMATSLRQRRLRPRLAPPFPRYPSPRPPRRPPPAPPPSVPGFCKLSGPQPPLQALQPPTSPDSNLHPPSRLMQPPVARRGGTQRWPGWRGTEGAAGGRQAAGPSQLISSPPHPLPPPRPRCARRVASAPPAEPPCVVWLLLTLRMLASPGPSLAGGGEREERERDRAARRPLCIPWTLPPSRHHFGTPAPALSRPPASSAWLMLRERGSP